MLCLPEAVTVYELTDVQTHMLRDPVDAVGFQCYQRQYNVFKRHQNLEEANAALLHTHTNALASPAKFWPNSFFGWSTRCMPATRVMHTSPNCVTTDLRSEVVHTATNTLQQSQH